jgi:MoxR-like ATPase
MVFDLHSLRTLQARTDAITVDRSVVRYAVDLVHATRDPARHQLADLVPYVAVGVSPRASIGLVRAAKALAVVRGRTYATPQDVFDVAPEILRHRIGLSYEALAREVHVEQVMQRILATVPAAFVHAPGWQAPKPIGDGR